MIGIFMGFLASSILASIAVEFSISDMGKRSFSGSEKQPNNFVKSKYGTFIDYDMQDLSKYDEKDFYDAYMNAVERCHLRENEAFIRQGIRLEMQESIKRYADYKHKVAIEKVEEYIAKSKAETERTKKYLEELKSDI